MAWKVTAEAKAIVLDLMIKEMVKNKDEIPTQLVEPVNNILIISSDIKSLKANHKANLKPLVHQASGLIIILWRLYIKDRYPSLWPPPLLNRTVDKFVKTVDSIRKLLARKCEKTFVKKTIFAVLDLGKVKKYLCKLDAAATNIEGDSRHVVDLNAVLLEAVNTYNNPKDEEVQRLEVIVPESVVEGSGQPDAEILSLADSDIVQEIEEDREVGTSTRVSRETLTSQSSPSSSEHVNTSFTNTGSIEEDHEVETSARASREALTSQSAPPLPHWHHMNTPLNLNNTSGVMINRNVGNIYKTKITNVGNNNSVNHYYR